jgi:hypothetical protein
MARSDVGMTLGDMAPGEVVCVLVANNDGTAWAWHGRVLSDGRLGRAFWRSDVVGHLEVHDEQMLSEDPDVRYDSKEDVFYLESPLWHQERLA